MNIVIVLLSGLIVLLLIYYAVFIRIKVKWQAVPVPVGSPCSVSCGGGTQVVTYKCYSNENDPNFAIVSDSVCVSAGLPKPSNVIQACNTQAC